MRRSGKGGGEGEGEGDDVLEMHDLAESLRQRGIKISKPSADTGAASVSASS